MPRQRRSEGRPTLDMHPDDAARRGLTDGQAVTVRGQGGHVTVTLRATDGVRTGVVSLPGKWWAVPDAAAGNLLTPPAWSPGGQPAYNGARVTVHGINEHRVTEHWVTVHGITEHGVTGAAGAGTFTPET